MTMREKMARAIYPFAWDDKNFPPCSSTQEYLKQDTLDRADACLRAMRDATPGMCEAGGFMFQSAVAGDPRHKARRTWQAMIYASLEGR